MSFRDVEDLLAERGIVSYETIRQWCARFCQDLQRHIPVELGVSGSIDFTHAAFADRL